MRQLLAPGSRCRSTSTVSVLVIDCTRTGASPPTVTTRDAPAPRAPGASGARAGAAASMACSRQDPVDGVSCGPSFQFDARDVVARAAAQVDRAGRGSVTCGGRGVADRQAQRQRAVEADASPGCSVRDSSTRPRASRTSIQDGSLARAPARRRRAARRRRCGTPAAGRRCTGSARRRRASRCRRPRVAARRPASARRRARRRSRRCAAGAQAPDRRLGAGAGVGPPAARDRRRRRGQHQPCCGQQVQIAAAASSSSASSPEHRLVRSKRQSLGSRAPGRSRKGVFRPLVDVLERGRRRPPAAARAPAWRRSSAPGRRLRQRAHEGRRRAARRSGRSPAPRACAAPP